jgi:hypothetical protein
MQYSYRLLALNIKAQTCSPYSVPLCGRTVTKTRLELNAEVMVTTTTTTIIIKKYHGNPQLTASLKKKTLRKAGDSNRSPLIC